MCRLATCFWVSVCTASPQGLSVAPLFSKRNRAKVDNTFISETTLFGWQSMILMSDLILLNINTSKNSTFA